MTKLLLSVHVLLAIIAIGPVTVAASMFAPAARTALTTPGDGDAVVRAATLHRVCRVYSAIGIAVPAFGLATAASLGVLGDIWLIASIVLTAAAAALLVGALLPGQRRVLTQLGSGTTGHPVPPTQDWPRITARLAMVTGMFNLLWAVVVVLMVVRPGSTTGV